MEKGTSKDITTSKHLNSKIEIIESNLHQTLYNFRDFANEFELLHMQAESVKKQILVQKEKCKSKCCIGSEELKKVIESKDNIIQHIASAITKLNETKNFDILTEIYKILFGESKSLDNIVTTKSELNSDEINIDAMSLISPKEEPPENMSIEEPDESVTEIEGTPTGRHSPIIQSKKLKPFAPNNIVLTEKKKCPQNWLTPEKKTGMITLTFPTPTRTKGSGRLRQQRINIVREKPSIVMDLTTTPQFSKGRNSQAVESIVKNIKQEVIENDDTIMPSPTSGPEFSPAFKSLSKDSPQKFKKPLSLIRKKVEKSLVTGGKENKLDDVTNVSELESMDLLKGYHNEFASPKKCNTSKTAPIIEADKSMSLLQQVNKRDAGQLFALTSSPTKRPLVENMNATNVSHNNEPSFSVQPADVKVKTEPPNENIRSKSQIPEPLYKEPTVRKKAEKRALPGWSCERCEKFYGELYKDNPEMLAKKMDECSKHRGRNNPVRPKTPPGYWEPRWDVPEDTEEFNRRNNAI